MNKLVLVGNGFDLAHGLKTGYGDFLLYYFQNLIGIAASKREKEFSDELCTIHFGQNLVIENVLQKIKKLDTFNDLQQLEIIHLMNDDAYHAKRSKFTGREVVIRIKHSFFSSLLLDGNWTNIEQHYFTQLLRAFEHSNQPIDDINSIFQLLITKLAAYLEEINKPLTNNIPEKLNSVIHRINELSTKSSKVLFVNFNYTQLFELYLKHHRPTSYPTRVLYIHGNLMSDKEIIFGYGDDSNEHYSKLENSLNDSYLHYIKSFNYPAQANYERLNNFIEADQFEVLVIGHSLGVSDRVLLKTIFENPNCTKIRLFHRGNAANHKRKYISLSRHFSDKVSMRKKIVSFDSKDQL